MGVVNVIDALHVPAGSPYLYLFDIDCTLLYTQGAGREATRRALADVYGTVGAIDGFLFSGKTDTRALREILAGEPLTEADFARHAERYREAVGRHLAAIIDGFAVTPMPGAHAVIAGLRAAGAMLGIITGNMSTSAAVKLRAAGFDPAWFPVGAYGEEAYSRDDLSPLALERASAYFGRPFTGAHTVIIGDTPMDVQCARAVGAVAVAVDTGFEGRAALEASQPDYLLGDLTEFGTVLAALHG